MSNSVWPHRWQPTRLPHPWNSPGKNTGVGCHFLLQRMKGKGKVKFLSRVWLLATLWTAVYQALPSMGFSRQECWSGLPLPSPTPSLKSPKQIISDMFCLLADSRHIIFWNKLFYTFEKSKAVCKILILIDLLWISIVLLTLNSHLVTYDHLCPLKLSSW